MVSRRRMSIRSAIAAATIASTCLLRPTLASPGANVALGRTYTLQPSPNYPGRTSRSGTAELTDGKLVRGTAIWLQDGTVGWSSAHPVTITIDLGSEQVLDDVTWHTAAGSADVEWPTGLYALGSVDGEHYAELGDLIAVAADSNGPPPQGHYADYTFVMRVPPIRVRYLRILADGNGEYLFVDEIEAHASTSRPAAADYPIVDMDAYFWSARTVARAIAGLRSDYSLVRARLTRVRDSDARGRLDTAATRSFSIAERSVRMHPPTTSAFPLTDGQAQLFATLGEAEAIDGVAPLTAWPANPWDPLTLLSAPASNELSRIDLVAMRGERRSSAFNIRNSTREPVIVTLDVQLPRADVQQLVLAPVIWTANEAAVWVAAKIGAPINSLSIPAGLTVQVWVSYISGTSASGLYQGHVKISSGKYGALLVPLAVRVFSTTFPPGPALRVAGWDYTSSATNYRITAANIDPAIGYLQASGVNVPWATREVLPTGTFDRDGRMVTPPATDVLDKWLARWPSADRYRVFIAAGKDLGGVRIESAAFPRAVKAWLDFWKGAIAQHKRTIESFELLLVDEPYNSTQAELALTWSRAVKAAGTGVRLWIDPRWRAPSDIPTELISLTDTVCIHLGVAERSDGKYWTWARTLGPKDIEVYGTDGPATMLDPYSYYLATAWRAFSVGAQGESFWSFSDNGAADSSNGLAAHAVQYVPFFLDHDAVSAGKHMEAIAAGRGDFVYLTMLHAIAIHGSTVALRNKAELLERDSVASVLKSASRFNSSWASPRDRSVADAWRVQIGTLIDEAQ